MRFPSQYRLRRAADFKAVRHRGKHINCDAFTLQVLQRTPKAKSKNRRFAVIASRRVGNAVKRNRGKRIFRELFRLNQDLLPTQCDLVVVVRASFIKYKFNDLSERFLRACGQRRG